MRLSKSTIVITEEEREIVRVRSRSKFQTDMESDLATSWEK